MNLEGASSSWWLKGVRVALFPFALLVGLPLLVLVSIIGALTVPIAFAMAGLQWTGEMRFRRRMQQCGRFINWGDLASDLGAGAGTLIIEQGQKCPVRVWWTSEDAISVAPCSPPTEQELDVHGLRAPHDFVVWCYHRYTHEGSGSAKLTVPSLELPPGLFFAKFFTERFPMMSVIDTVYLRDGRNAETEV